MYKLFTKKNCYIVICGIFLTIILDGCAAHMAMPMQLENNSTKMSVEGRAFSDFSGEFNFGKYHVSNIHRGWTKRSGATILGYGSSKVEQKYEFSIDESGRNLWAVECVSAASWDHATLGEFLGGKLSIESSSDPQLVCKITGNNNAEVAAIIMSQSYDSNTLQGNVTDGKTAIDISGVDKFSTSSLSMGQATGYVFSINGDPIGAVKVINSGNVWISKSVNQEDKSLISTTSVAMLLYQDLKKSSS
ncbi:hypothetical protein [Francisella sp. SYW-9]|uniref:hypothetical protein n=1 Tax=Francisella sp. SYW-9 TaxID=2610888 RepID=UPI00123E0717|nr:hypothetical protein [Francisella sp. SYW-9]